MVAKCHPRQSDNQKSPARNRLLLQYRWSSQLSVTAIPFILFQQSKQFSPEIWRIFCSCLFKEQWPHNSFLKHSAPNTNLWQIQRIPKQCIWVFNTPYSAAFSTDVSTQVEPSFMHKKQTVQYINSFFKKQVDYTIAALLAANKTEGHWTYTERLSKCWKCPLHRGRASYIRLFQYLYVTHLWVACYMLHFVCLQLFPYISFQSNRYKNI